MRTCAKKMSGPDKSYGWYTAHNFNDYMEKVIGAYGDELEKMGFNDESETDYMDSVKFCADLVWNGEFALNIIGIIKFFTFSPEYQVKQEEAHPRPDTALVMNKMVVTVTTDGATKIWSGCESKKDRKSVV